MSTVAERLMPPDVDDVTSALKSISTDHAYIHDGKLFEAFDHFTLAAGATRYITVTTPATGYIHYRSEKVSCSGDKLLVQLFEGPTITVAGSALAAINHNRLSSAVASVSIKDGATITVDGTKIAETYIGGGTGVGGSGSGGETKAENEIVLKQATAYAIKITNGSAAENIVQINPLWYEESA